MHVLRHWVKCCRSWQERTTKTSSLCWSHFVCKGPPFRRICWNLAVKENDGQHCLLCSSLSLRSTLFPVPDEEHQVDRCVECDVHGAHKPRLSNNLDEKCLSLAESNGKTNLHHITDRQLKQTLLRNHVGCHEEEYVACTECSSKVSIATPSTELCREEHLAAVLDALDSKDQGTWIL